MFFPSSAPKVSLGGRSQSGSSRAELLERSKREREKRQQQKAEHAAALKIQANYRGWTSRKQLRAQWRKQLEEMLSSPSSESTISSSQLLLSLFHRCYRPENGADLEILSAVCEALTSVMAGGDRGADVKLVSFHAARTASAILATFYKQRESLLPVLLSTPDCSHSDVQLTCASSAIQSLKLMTSPASWTGFVFEDADRILADIISVLADESMLLQISMILTTAMDQSFVAKPDSICVAELVVSHLFSQYKHASKLFPDNKTVQHSPWILLTTPGIFARSPILRQHAAALLPVMLDSLLNLPPVSIWRMLRQSADVHGGGDDSQEACHWAMSRCCLQVLSNMAHSVGCTSSELTACHVLAYSRATRLLVSLLPSRTRACLASILVDVSGQHQHVSRISADKWLGTEDMNMDEDADDPFSGAAWLFPYVDKTSLKSRRFSTACTKPADAVEFPIPLAGTRVIEKLAEACSTDQKCTDADAVHELSLWLFMMMSLNSSDQLARDKLIATWANASCSLVRILWQQGVRPLSGGRLSDYRTVADPVDVLWEPGNSVQQWMVPLMVLSAIYAQHVSTAPDAVLFSEQAPLPKSQLAPRPGVSETGHFIPFLRDALFHAFFSGQQSAGKSKHNSGVIRSFKVLAGRLFGKLHARAARISDISDSCFHARDLQHARFHKDVKQALGIIDIFGDDPIEDGNHDPRALSAFVEVLKYAPGMARFDDRAIVFQQLVGNDRDKNVSLRGFTSQAGLAATIRRKHVFLDSLQLMADLPSTDLKNRLRITFIDDQGQAEPGIDGGGLFKDFIENLLQEAFHPDLGLFLQTDDGAMYPNPAASSMFPHAGYNVRDAFRLLGSMLGKAMYEGIIVELPLAAFFLKKLRGSTSDLNDLPSLDQQLYDNLMKLTDTALDVESVGLNFTIISKASGYEREVPLMPNGESITVTQSNLALYLTLVADYRLNREIASNSAAVMHGFTKLIEPAWLNMFNDRELQQLISGDSRGGFDVEDLRLHVALGGGFHADHEIILRFWKVLARLTVKQQSSFLKFVTACSRPPLLGFKYMQPPMAINMRGHVGSHEDENALPTASTCFNLLKLPPYTDENIMLDKLLLAIEGTTSFDLS